MAKPVSNLHIQLLLFYIFFNTLFLFPLRSIANADILYNRVSLTLEDETVEKSIELLEGKTQLTFSYNPEAFPVDSLVNLNLLDVTIQDAVKAVVGENVSFRVIGDIVIIRTALPDSKNKKKSVSVTGAITDRQNGQNLENATVIMVESKYATQSKSTGNFDLEMNSGDDYVELYISKENYIDTVIHIPASKVVALDIALEPIKPSDVQFIDHTLQSARIEDLSVVKLTVPRRQAKFTENLQQYSVNMDAQVSLLPFIGSHMLTNSVSTNKYSFNVLAGYSGAIDGVELGSILNIVRGDVRGLQIGGIGNVVGGSVKGVQLAGFGNNSRNNISGVQAAGFYNVVLDSIKGVQAAGYVNLAHGKVHGWQVAGFLNASSGELQGIQGAGFLNISGQSIKGGQVAGFANLGRGSSTGFQLAGYVNAMVDIDGSQVAGAINVSLGQMNGLQLSGLANVSGTSFHGSQITGLANFSYKDYEGTRMSCVTNIGLGDGVGTDLSVLLNFTLGALNGTQISCLTNYCGDELNGTQITVLNNYAGDVAGAQVSIVENTADNLNGAQVGILNIADTVRGVQFGIVNIADSVHGVSIGLLSLVKHGYRSFSIEGGDNYLPRLSLKMGTQSLYNIFAISRVGTPDTSNAVVGYGIGTRHFFGASKLFYSAEALANVMISDSKTSDTPSWYYDFSLNLGRRVGKHSDFYAGPVAYINTHSDAKHTSHIPVLRSSTTGSKTIDYWVGYHLGISF